MDLSIIIVNWNSVGYLRKCLDSLRAGLKDLDYEILVIDNASYDGSARMMAADFREVRFFQSKTNLGFAAANNYGYRQSYGSHLLFLNPDTEILGNAVAQLIQATKLPNAGVIGARLLNTDGSTQTNSLQPFLTLLNQLLDVRFLQRAFPRARLWGLAALYSSDPGPQSVQGISGACMLVSRLVFEQVGLFSNDYFMYAEDIDLCFKVHRAGFSNYFVPTARIVHHGGSSSSQVGNCFASVMMRESARRYFRKHHGRLWALGFRLVMLIGACIRLLGLSVFAPGCLWKHQAAPWKSRCAKWYMILQWALGKPLKAAPLR